MAGTLANTTPAEVVTASPIGSAAGLLVAYLGGHGEGTRRSYAADLRHFSAFLDTIEVDALAAHRVHLDAYARTCEAEGMAPSTLARRLSAVSGFYAYALDEGMVSRNPVERVKRPKVSDDSATEGLDRHEIVAFLSAAEASSARDHALALLLTLNGLRVSEALAADAADLGDARGHRTLRVTRKGAKGATVPLAPRTAAAVDALLDGRTTGPIFRTATGKAVDRQAAWKVVRRLAKAAGITKRIHPHSLRHSFVTAALDAGVPLHLVQDAAGHADPRTTRRYDRKRGSLDNHATYAVASYVSDAGDA